MFYKVIRKTSLRSYFRSFLNTLRK